MKHVETSFTSIKNKTVLYFVTFFKEEEEKRLFFNSLGANLMAAQRLVKHLSNGLKWCHKIKHKNRKKKG